MQTIDRLWEFLLVNSNSGAEYTHGYPVEKFLIVFAILLLSSKIIGEVAERIKQPAVLGELVAGVILGGSVLGLVPSSPGMDGFQIFHLLAEVGVVILLFEIGLETDLNDLLKVGITSMIVACVGVISPFILGYLSVIMFFKIELLSHVEPHLVTLIAITTGATLTATSVGITARVLSDMNKIQTAEAKIILGAAVIDDILGLIILAVVTGLIQAYEHGSAGGISVVGITVITAKAFGFLVVSIFIGMLFSKKLFNIVEKMKVRGILLLSSLTFALTFSYLAIKVGLAPIVGAFAAGLVLAKTHQIKTIETRLKPVSDVFTPIFFIMVGAQVDIRVFNPFNSGNIPILVIAGVLTLVAVIGKIVSGLSVTRKNISKKVIGVGMIPRGEVGLIFAQTGLAFGILSTKLFSALTVMVMLTTFIAPPLLKITFSNSKTTDE